MGGFCFKNVTFMIMVVLLLGCSYIETGNAKRMGRHRRQSRNTAASLSKKKGKSHGSNHHNGKPKQKTPSPKAPPPPPSTAPSPKKGGGGGGGYAPASTVLNVLDFGAKGDGCSDDTKVIKLKPFITTSICLSQLHVNLVVG